MPESTSKGQKKRPTPNTNCADKSMRIECRYRSTASERPTSMSRVMSASHVDATKRRRPSSKRELRKKHVHDFDTAIGLYGDRFSRPIPITNIFDVDMPRSIVKRRKRDATKVQPVEKSSNDVIGRRPPADDVDTVLARTDRPIETDTRLQEFLPVGLLVECERLDEDRQLDHCEKVTEWLDRSEAAVQACETRRDVETSVDDDDIQTIVSSSHDRSRRRRPPPSSCKKSVESAQKYARARARKYIQMLDSITTRIEKLNVKLDERRRDVPTKTVGRKSSAEDGTSKVIDNLHSMMRSLIVGADASTPRRRAPTEPRLGVPDRPVGRATKTRRDRITRDAPAVDRQEGPVIDRRRHGVEKSIQTDGTTPESELEPILSDRVRRRVETTLKQVRRPIVGPTDYVDDFEIDEEEHRRTPDVETLHEIRRGAFEVIPEDVEEDETIAPTPISANVEEAYFKSIDRMKRTGEIRSKQHDDEIVRRATRKSVPTIGKKFGKMQKIFRAKHRNIVSRSSATLRA